MIQKNKFTVDGHINPEYIIAYINPKTYYSTMFYIQAKKIHHEKPTFFSKSYTQQLAIHDTMNTLRNVLTNNPHLQTR